MKADNKTELLSPAGSWDALVAAVQSGADAVYLGGTAFSARAGADNFDNQQLIDAVKYCHIRGVKVFVTLNTLLKQTELQQAVDFASFLYHEAGIDALIIQDLGLSALLLRALPGLALHASTQMSVHSIAGAQKLAALGFKRVVLARELSFDQIRAIKEAVDIELEIFVHGAICQCYSGQCLFSSVLGGRSGNRGRCAQPCRLPYELSNTNGKALKKGYLLSPKDMCLLSHLREIKRAGVDSLKIEGRLKRPEYVAAVTEIYRKYLDSGTKPTPQDIQALLDAFNRSGFTDGYFTGKTGAQMMSYASPSNVSPERFYADIKKRFAPNANFRLVDVWAEGKIVHGRNIMLTLTDCDGNVVTAEGEKPQAAHSTPLSYERAYAQLSKFGSVPFRLKELQLTIDDGLSVSISGLNALRREACEKLIAVRGKVKSEESEAAAIGFIGMGGDEKEELCISVRTLEQANAVLKFSPDKLYIPLKLAGKLSAFTGKTEIITSLPAIVDNNKEMLYDAVPTKGALCSSLGAAARLCGAHTVYGDWRLNVYNTAAVQLCMENGIARVTLSPELNLREIAAFGAMASACEAIVYGRLPLMVMKNCVIKACGGVCGKDKGIYWLTDRKKQAFPVICEPDSCTNLLLNAKPLYMADKLGDLNVCGIKKFRLMFTTESPDECVRITREYMRAMQGEMVKNSFLENEFTRGHFYRGVT